MNIAHVVYNYWGYSGASNQARKLANTLSQNHNVNNIFISDNTAIDEKSQLKNNDGLFQVYNMPKNNLSKLIWLFRILKKNKIDVIHLHGFHRIVIICCLFLKIKVFLKSTLDGRDDFYSLLSGNSLKRSINKVLLNRIDINNALTDIIYEKNMQSCPDISIEVIPNGVNLVNNSILPNKNEKIAVFVGAIVPRKRPLESIKFFANHLHRKGYKLLLVGPNDPSLPEFDQTYYNSCYAFAEDYINEGTIQFTGNLPKDELDSLYEKAAMLLFFSEREGMPNVVIESISWNCVPVVFQSEPIIESILSKPYYAQLSLNATFCNAEQVIEAAESLVLTDQLMEQSKNFDINTIADRHYQNYVKLLN
ncbi:glycosyltransferase family 4 protein [Photobacterium sp. DNB22_13_2]